MKLLLVMCLAVWGLITTPAQTIAQDYQSLFRDFDPQSLTSNDKRFLQTALAFEGHYNGLLDGAWGRLSQRAMTGYSRAEFGSETQNWHMAMLAWSFFQRADADGWKMRYLRPLGMSMLWPEKAYVADAPSERFLNFRHTRSSLSISIGIHDPSVAQSVHNYTLGTHEHATQPYSVRKQDLAVSSATRRDGSTLYARSNFVDGAWSTIMIFANKSDGPILNAVAASIEVGPSRPLAIASGGALEEAIMAATALAEEADGNRQVARSQDARPQPEKRAESTGGSGSGFVVSSAGHVLTNAHVVSGCGRIAVDGQPASLKGISAEFDLALVQSASISGKAVAVFSATSAKLNSDVTAVGFPYAGLLGGLNVTRGSVSSLKGIGGDQTTMQITAPVQTGNSGGPLLSSDGEVVGVVVSKLDAVKVADVLGDLPQNVNFAIRGEIAKMFLAQNGLDPVLSLSDERLEPEVLAERAKGFTVFVECE